MKFLLRPLLMKDAARMLEWMHDEDSTRFLRIKGEDTTLEDALAFIELSKNEMINLHRAVVNEKDEYFGTISLKNINNETSEAEYAIAMHPEARGKGVAFEASKLILSIAFSQLGLKRIYLNVLEDNQRAVAFYRKLGKLGLREIEPTTILIEEEEKTLLWFETKR